MTVDELRSNLDFVRRVGGALMHVADGSSDRRCARLEYEQECPRRAESVVAQERASEAAEAARLRSECAQALGEIQRLRVDGSHAVNAAKEEAAQNASAANMFKRQLDIAIRRRGWKSRRRALLPNDDIGTA